jgi:hypothetical protein
MTSSYNRLFNLFSDDALYYAVIARNFSDGFGASFDKIEVTNGYHPLWLMVLSFINKITPLKGFDGIVAVLVVCLAFYVCGILIYSQLLKKFNVSNNRILLFAISSILMCGTADFGQETSLYFLLLSIFVYLTVGYIKIDSAKVMPIKNGLNIFLLTALIVFSRLDAILLLLSFVVYFVISKQFRIAATVTFGICSSLCIEAYYNYQVFSHIPTISSYLKSGFKFSNIENISYLGISLRMLMALLLVFSATFPNSRVIPKVFIKITFAILIFYFSIVIFYVQAPASWYVTVPLGYSILIFFIAFGTSESKESSFKTNLVIVIASALISFVGGGVFLKKVFIDNNRQSQIDVAEYIYKMGGGHVYFQVDSAGFVSYFSEKKLINGDGLVNNYRFQSYVKSRKICDYLQSMNVRYLVTNSTPGESGIVIDSIPTWRGSNRMLSSRIPFFSVNIEKSLYRTYSAGPLFSVYDVKDVNLICE